MKLCTKIRADCRQVDDDVWVAGAVDVIDVSVVPDDHEFGIDADGFLHIKGEITAR